jgi:hypothetical protein
MLQDVNKKFSLSFHPLSEEGEYQENGSPIISNLERMKEMNCRDT